ncbi:low molecular weight phosphatase family protein [Alienimonas californiensis]|uniref:Protein ArsC n=1 Tax=Alienimonas californiensis TaxID=2527989 RepID=A0A517P6H7_9PLAN|nr:protein-tyrosine-phosphatase [Alienimonas californiensis]QDT14979.1 Protein ArsC [Alienimonas californiensis]
MPSAALLTLALLAGADAESSAMTPELTNYVSARVDEFDQIPAARKADLERLAAYVRAQRDAGQPARLTFICTHNSRRSHLGQLWAAVAATHYGVDEVKTFSGGTEATAFNSRAVAALQRAGFEIESNGAEANPRYTVTLGETRPASVCFSKKYDEAPNPRADFAAIIVCTDADEACPIVPGAAARFALPYEDPKVADDTPAEAERYDERTAQIGREFLYAFSRVR